MPQGSAQSPMITGVEKVACSFISDADEKDSGKFAMKRDTSVFFLFQMFFPAFFSTKI